MLQNFWKRWSKEYLHSSQTRYKWQNNQPEAQVGDIVLITDSITPPAKWPLAKIVETMYGKDDHTRVVKLRIALAEFIRPITKLVLLSKNENVTLQILIWDFMSCIMYFEVSFFFVYLFFAIIFCSKMKWTKCLDTICLCQYMGLGVCAMRLGCYEIKGRESSCSIVIESKAVTPFSGWIKSLKIISSNFSRSFHSIRFFH